MSLYQAIQGSLDFCISRSMDLQILVYQHLWILGVWYLYIFGSLDPGISTSSDPGISTSSACRMFVSLHPSIQGSLDFHISTSTDLQTLIYEHLQILGGLYSAPLIAARIWSFQRNPVEWNLAGRPAIFCIPVSYHSGRIWAFQNWDQNVLWNLQEWKATESGYLFGTCPLPNNQCCFFGNGSPLFLSLPSPLPPAFATAATLHHSCHPSSLPTIG